MASYDLEEQEQIAEIKAWWKQYGNVITALVTVAAVAVTGWQVWNWYQRSQAGQASMVFGALRKAVLENDTQRVKAASGELLEKFGSTAYAPLAALTAARAIADAGDAKTAKLQLVWVAEHAQNELRDLARLRLAVLLLDENAYDEALKQLDGETSGAFAARFADTRGDVISARGDKVAARAAYQNALSKLEETDQPGKEKNTLQDRQASAAYREMLQEKLDSLGEGK